MLFKATNNDKSEEIKNYIPVTVLAKFNQVSPFIDIAESAYLIPLIGLKLYNKIQAHYDNTGSGSSGSGDADENQKYAGLLKLCQRAIINLAYFRGFQFLNTTISDNGFQRAESEQYKSLYKYQEDELKNGFKINGFNGLDDILEYLEENLEYFPEFENSGNYLEVKGAIIPSTKILYQIWGNIAEKSRLVFLKIQSFINMAEIFEIKKTLGPTLYNYVKTEIKKAEPAVKATNLLPYIRKALAYFAIAYGIDEMGVNITDKMIYFESTEPTSVNSLKQTTVPIEVLQGLSAKARLTGEKYLEDLKQYLIEKSTVYTEYSGQSGSVYHGRDNASKKTFFT